MNIKNLFQKEKPKKLNTMTRRATMPVAQDYDTDEPNVRLSRAFLVVMLLHVVAVGGIFAFSSIKKNSPAAIDPVVAEAVTNTAELPADSRSYVVRPTDTLGSIASTFGLTRNDLETANHLGENASLQPGNKLIIPAKSTAQAVPLNVQKLLQLSQTARPAKENAIAAPPREGKPTESVSSETGKIYVVQKGDNPVLIAKKHGVKQSDLLAANKITDPKKLQIGQRLVIPPK